MNTQTEPKITVTATITRADGRIEDLGVVASNTTSTGSRALARLKTFLKGTDHAG